MELNLKQPGERVSLGLSDHGIVSATCSQCKKDLMIFQLTKTNEELVRENIQPITTKIAVFCERCNHINQVITIKGQFYPGCANDETRFEIDETILHGHGMTPDCNIIFRVKTNA